MRRLSALALLGLSAMVMASDHNNIEAGRPLRFDDAYSIAYRERAFEFGLSLDSFRRRASDLGFKSEFKYGFAKNQDIAIAFEPHWRGGDRFDAGRVELSYFNGLRREIDDSPALAVRVDAGIPASNDERGIDLRFRGIATKALGQYDKLHLNLDLNMRTDTTPGERRHTVDAILGYSTPLGYPKRFDQTLVAEFALIQGKKNGEGYTGSLGVGLRRQIDPRSVIDIGISTDLFSGRGVERSPFRLAIGYSVGF
ncbi:MAG: hypothetical protein AB7V39_15040 [Nitrospiraceae bacterium]